MSYVPRYAEAFNKAYGVYPRFTDYDIAREVLVNLASYRYSFETFDCEDTYLESDLYKLGLLDRLNNYPAKTNEHAEEAERLCDASHTQVAEIATCHTPSTEVDVINKLCIVP